MNINLTSLTKPNLLLGSLAFIWGSFGYSTLNSKVVLVTTPNQVVLIPKPVKFPNWVIFLTTSLVPKPKFESFGVKYNLNTVLYNAFVVKEIPKKKEKKINSCCCDLYL